MAPRAVILAGGLGTRLRPYTAVVPKPLMPLGDRPILDVILRQLSHHGVDDVTIATGYLAELIESFVGDGSRYGLRVGYHREDEPMGTAGALAVLDDLPDNFLVMNGDVLTSLSYSEFLSDHASSGASLTIAGQRRHIQVELGVMEHDGTDPCQLTGYVEKPQYDYIASMGIYGFHRSALEVIDPGAHLEFPDLVLACLRAGLSVRSWPSDAYWLDIGRHDDYETAVSDFLRMEHRLLPPTRHPPADRRSSAG